MRGDLARLQGTWNVTSLETNGQSLPASGFAGATIVVEGSTFRSLGMGATYEGTLELETRSTPKAFDLVFTAGHAQGHRNLGIYQLKGDSWTICLATDGDTRPEKFQTTPGSGFALEILERAGPTHKSEKQPSKTARVHSSSRPMETETATSSVSTELEGEWQMTAGVFNGLAMDDSMVKWCKRVSRGNVTKVLAGPQVFLHATFTLDYSQQPPTIDYINLTGPGKGKAQAGIFELRGDVLEICMSGPEQPRPGGFSSQPGDNLTYTVWRRVET